MSLRPIVLFGMIASIVGGVMLGIGTYWLLQRGNEAARNERLLLSVVREVGRAYVEEVPQARLVDDAIRGVIRGLDGHSAFLDEQALDVLEEETSGRFGGIGVTLGLDDGFVTVLAPMAGAPAERAGIVAGDRVMQVDHESIAEGSVDDAAERLRGEPGTDVHLRVRRGADDEPLDFDLVRDTIELSSVEEPRMLEPGYGYARITKFIDTTTEDLKDAVAGLSPDAPLAGLVLDLRDNPGGLLDESVAVADAFLDGGAIVRTQGRARNSETDYLADAEDILGGAPLAVLVDGNTASAAEVVAGALQDHERGVVLGTKSFGKGSVQSVRFLQRDRAIKLTTARYVTPSGRSLHENGVTPDVSVERQEGESRADYDERLLAAALAELRG